MIPLWMLAPAIAVGNAFILKPSERAPSAALWLVELAHEAGVPPPGVVNVVHGRQDVGEAITDHPDVKAVTFIGSTDVAKAVYARTRAPSWSSTGGAGAYRDRREGFSCGRP
jgi:malonate-semialdehyde dehydrogenase (acetylating) / methylmalonate-semialdehyde dehydrogenase